MKTIKSCEFNMDTGCVELRFQYGSMISIDCTAVENEVRIIFMSGRSWTTSSTTTRWLMQTSF